MAIYLKEQEYRCRKEYGVERLMLRQMQQGIWSREADVETDAARNMEQRG